MKQLLRERLRPLASLGILTTILGGLAAGAEVAMLPQEVGIIAHAWANRGDGVGEQAEVAPKALVLAGIALHAYNDGLKTGMTSPRDVSNQGKNLETTIALPDGSSAILSVKSSASRKGPRNVREPDARYVESISVMQSGDAVNTQAITLSRHNSDSTAPWNVILVTPQPNSYEHVAVAAPHNGQLDSVVSFTTLNGDLVVGSEETMFGKPQAETFCDRSTATAAGIAKLALQAAQTHQPLMQPV